MGNMVENKKKEMWILSRVSYNIPSGDIIRLVLSPSIPFSSPDYFSGVQKLYRYHQGIVLSPPGGTFLFCNIPMNMDTVIRSNDVDSPFRS